MIDETEKSGKRENNLLWALLDLRKNGDEDDDLTDAEILANFIGLFTGGSETSSHLISSAIYFMWKNPEVLRRVKEEVDQVFANEDSIKLEDVNKMEYMSNVIKETLRLGGPISLLQPRIAMRDDEMCGVKIKKGTVVNYYHNVYYMNERYYPNPLEFNPDRWSAKSAEGHKEEPFANLPFSAGPRNCLGQHFAQIMIKMVLGFFVKSFDFEFAPGYMMVMTQKTTYEPLDPRKVWLRPKMR